MTSNTEQFWTEFTAHTLGGPAPYELMLCYCSISSTAPPKDQMAVITIGGDPLALRLGFLDLAMLIADVIADGDVPALVKQLQAGPSEGHAWVLVSTERGHTTLVSVRKLWS